MKIIFTPLGFFSFADFYKTFRYRSHLMIIIFFLFACTLTGRCQWADRMGSTGPDYGQAVATDKNGNVFVTGTFTGTADFDPGPATFILSAACPCNGSDPNYDIFLAKYNSSGNFLWAIKIGGAQRDRATALAADSSGNIYITGEFRATADFDPGTGTRNLVSAGGNDIFLAKYDANGSLLWANNFGGVIDDAGTGLTVDGNSNIFITGSFFGTVDFDPGAGNTSFNSNSTTDIFFAEYSSTGSLVWAKQIEGTGEQGGKAITRDRLGNIYLTGSFFGTSDLDPGPGVTNLTGAGAQDPFFAKYTSTGNLIWANSIGNFGDEVAADIAVDASGNLFVAGYFVGVNVDFDPGSGVTPLSTSSGSFNGFLLKLNTDGAFQWVFKIGEINNENALAVAVDGAGNPYICGTFQGNVDFDPGTGSSLLTAAGNDLYYAKYDTDGNFLWAKSNGSSSDEGAADVQVDATGAVYLTGYFLGSSAFQTGTGTTVLNSTGNADIFLLKYLPFATNLSSGSNPSCGSSAILLTATVTPALSTGTVEFFDGTTSLGISLLSGGTATLSISSLSAGSHSLTAVYSGDVNYPASTSAILTQVVNSAPAMPGVISGIANQCPSLTEQIYSITPVADAVTYNWSVPSGWIITNGAGTNTIAVTTGNIGQDGNIIVTATNSCGTSAPSTLAVTVGNVALPAPGTINGSTPVCAGITALTYSIAAVPGATSYIWTVPLGWIITAGAGTISITVTSGTSGGNITVTANNSCGNSNAQTKIITVTPVPATPGIITGISTVCPNTSSLGFSISSVSDASSYTWTVPAGWVINSGQGTTSIFATSGIAGGNITIAAVNTCGSSAAPRTVNLNPVNATDNTGYTDGATKSSDLVVTSTATLPVRRGYLKFPLSALPAGATITASTLKLTNNGTAGSSGSANTVRGLGSNDPVTATAANIFNAAATGTPYSSNVWGNTGQISLPLLPAANTDITNSIAAGYIAMGLLRGGGSNIYNFFGYSAGTSTPVLTVTYASLRSFAVTVNSLASPGTISGAAGVCPNSTGNIYSISAVTDATTYNWIVPTGWTITAGAGTNSITVTAGNTGQNGSITVTAGNSCGISAMQSSAVATYTRPAINATPATQTRCSGIAIGTINITDPNAATGTVFNWTRDNSSLTGIATNGTGGTIDGTFTNILATQQTTNFTITATASGCSALSPVVVTVIVNPNPLANAGVDQSTCAATPAVIGGLPTATGGTPGYTYLWSAGVSDQSISNPSALPGSYSVTVTDSRGCKATDAVTISVGSGTKTWVGSGVPAGAGQDNNFNNPLNWTPAGVPGACNDVIMNVDISNILNLFSGNLSVNLNAPVTIKSLSINVAGTIILSTNTSFKLDIGNNAFTILNNTQINTSASTVLSNPAKSYISIGATGILTYGGNLVTSASNSNTNYPLYAAVNNTGKVYINSSATLAGIGNDPSNKPARVIFNGTGTQTITNNSGSQVIYLGATATDIGETNSPTVVLAGSGTSGFRNMGDLNVNNVSVLDIGTTQTMNRNTTGGTINLAAGTFLKLGKNNGGAGASNFPSGYTSYNFNPTSTVDYNAATSQAVFTTALYGNLTLSNSSSKTLAANITAQKNITIQGAAIFTGGANTITLGGNWTNYAQAGFSEQTSTVDFNGTGAQTINATGGEIFYSLKKSAAGITTLLSDVAVQGAGTSSFTLSGGIFDAGIFSFNSSTSAFNISSGLLRLAKTDISLLPEFAVASYNITGGTIELYGSGDQVLRGSRDYRDLIFSTGGIKTISSAIPLITGTIFTMNSVTLNVSNNTMGGAGTNLTMNGTSVYKTAGTGTKPDAQGNYTLGTGTTVEFTNSAATSEDVRLISPTYYNVIVSGNNVSNTSAATGIKFQPGGSFTVKNSGLFKLANTAGFSGTAVTSVSNTNSPAIILEDGSTVEYYGGSAGTNPQIISNVIPYYSLNFSGSSVKTAPAGILTVRGNLSNNASGFAHNNGTILLNGSAAQDYNSTGTTLDWYNFTAVNSVNVNINGDLAVNNLLSLGNGGRLNLAAGNISLRSRAAGTAAIDKIILPNSITYSGTGQFIAERYIPAGLNHGKSWQFLATPAFGSSVNATWQEGNLPLVAGTTGLGTTLSSSMPGAVARGYDFYTASGPSIKTYNNATNGWDGIDDGLTSTASVPLANAKGYMIFVRGDRSVQTSASPANPTTLRSRGRLYSPGTDAPASVNVFPGRFESAGNPYASAIDLANVVTSSAGIDNKFYVWDPLLPGSSGYGYGGYQLLSSVNGWLPIPGGTTNYPNGIACTKVQSGQAFLVYSTTGGTLNFNENNKITGSSMVYRHHDASAGHFLRAYLYGQSGYLADGNVIALSPSFTNNFDRDDAIKEMNTGENFGISNGNNILALDAHHTIINTDTIFYNIGGLHSNQAYQFRFAPANMAMPGLTAFLVDSLTGISNPVSLTDSTFIDFNITAEPASASRGRFYLVFKVSRPIPSTHIEVSSRSDNSSGISVSPNPVTGKTMHIYFTGQPSGRYELELINNAGQVILQRSVSVAEKEVMQSVRTGKQVPAGNYRLRVIAPAGTVYSIPLVIE